MTTKISTPQGNTNNGGSPLAQDTNNNEDPVATADPCEPVWVTIVGAGITGLTAAHELVERGFKVQVIEKERGSPMDIRRAVGPKGCPASTEAGTDDTDTTATEAQQAEVDAATLLSVGNTLVDVGGVARTQWAALPEDICVPIGREDEPIQVTELDGGSSTSASSLRARRAIARAIGDAILPEFLATAAGVLADASVKKFQDAIDKLRSQLTAPAIPPRNALASLLRTIVRWNNTAGLQGLARTLVHTLRHWSKENGHEQLNEALASVATHHEGAATHAAPTSAQTPPPPRPTISFGRAPRVSPDMNGEVNETLFAIRFDQHSRPVPGWEAALGDWLNEPARQRLARGTAFLRLVVVRHVGKDGEWPRPGAADDRLVALQDVLAELGDSEPIDIIVRAKKSPMVEAEIAATEEASEDSLAFLFELIDDGRLVAGEHGYRFFAGFYRHLRDTMKRTPIYDETRCEFTTRTVHDNLAPVSWQAVADPERAHPTAFPREPVRSLTEARDVYRRIRRDLGYRPSDILRFMLRILRYMTSSSERRASSYEDLTWWDFLSLNTLRTRPSSQSQPANAERLPYGRRFAYALQHSPQALVAMNADLADARTQGNVSVQLLMDNLGLHEQGDSTLTGPTSEAWFRHWRTYLEHQGVKFYAAEVKKITHTTASGFDLKFSASDLPTLQQSDYQDPTKNRDHHYIVCATDLQAAADLTKSLAPEGVLAKLNALAFHDENNNVADPRTTLISGNAHPRHQTLTGIQLYYASRLSFSDAHVYFAQSPWGLSAVSQFQYWRPYLDASRPKNRFLGNLSIDIGAWKARTQADEAGWTPYERQRVELGDNVENAYGDPSTSNSIDIATSVQNQIIECLGTVGGKTAPHAPYFHLDDYIKLDEHNVPKRNDYPYLINLYADWKSRPAGEPWSPLDGAMRSRIPGDGSYSLDGHVWDQGGYLVHRDQLVFAGTYMRTYTRLGTMESANESARHAVNAILDHRASDDEISDLSSAADEAAQPPWDEPSKVEPQYLWTPYGDYCTIWDPERNEIADLEFAKLVDKYLHGRKSPEQPAPQFMDDTPGPFTRPDATTHVEDWPHMFDLLELDRLPDLVDDDADALRVFDVLNAGLQALRESDSLEDTAIARTLVRVRTQVQALFRTRSS